MQSWSVIATIEKSDQNILSFAAEMHLLGAAQIVLFIDEADQTHQPTLPQLQKIDNLTIQMTNAEYWQSLGINKPASAHSRMVQNAFYAYQNLIKTNWMIPLCANEKLAANGLISNLLTAETLDAFELKPYEKFEFRRSNHGGQPTAIYRSALPKGKANVRFGRSIYGSNYPNSNRGLLGRNQSRYFFNLRTPFQFEEFSSLLSQNFTTAPPKGEYFLLRDFAENYKDWLTKPKKPKMPNTEEFYKSINLYKPNKKKLNKTNHIHTHFSWINDYQAQLLGEKPRQMHNIALDPKTGKLEGTINWDGIKMRLSPVGNYTELCLSRGNPPEAKEHEHIRQITQGRRVRFYDVGANAGVYSLRIAHFADPASKITAYEPNPEMSARLERNIKLNGFTNIEIKRAAITEEAGTVNFAIHDKNLGQSHITSAETGMSVPALRLIDELEDPTPYDLSLIKVDVEGFEPAVFASLFTKPADQIWWPGFILMEQAHSQKWRDELFAKFKNLGYEIYYQNPRNIIWQFKPNSQE